MPSRRALASILILLLSGLPAGLDAQQGCQAPPVAARPGDSIFAPAQENDLGDAVAEHLGRNFHVIDDEEVTGYLQRVGARLLRNLPATDVRFQFFLFDLPVANAFSLPGGRIYVSRKLVAFAHSENELAGVLAHEIGHMLVHESAATVSHAMKEALGVTQVTDRRDIYDKYNRLLDNLGRKPSAMPQNQKREERGQMVADTLAIYAVARAGYSPQGFVDFWDRFAETKGKTGSVLGDFFGVTKPESRRLREMIKIAGSLPPGCVESHAAEAPEAFQKWQTAVVSYSGLGHKEMLHGMLAKKMLEPPLRSDIAHLKFSADGSYVLAQDDASIYVLSRSPFQVLFRIDAPDAHPAQFTPDSKWVVFYDPRLRVEWWSIAGEQRVAAHEVVIQKGCLQTALSPDGKLLACYGQEFELSLFDVASGAVAFQKKSFYEPTGLSAFLFWILIALGNEGDINIDFLHFAFSPDGRYFAAGGPEETALAVDLATRAQVPLHGPIKKLMSGGFTFLGSDRVVGVDRGKPEKSAVVRFPDGEMVTQLTLGQQSLAAPAHGDYLLLRPIQKYPLGVMDLNSKKIILANKKGAFDLYDQTYVSERRNGELGLYNAGPVNEPLATVLLPRGPLGRLRAVALSPDLKWLAISGRDRGAVWSLAGGERIFHVRGFRGAYFGNDGVLYADFPKYDQTPRMVARLNLARREVGDGPAIEDARADQYGPYLVLTKSAKKNSSLSENVTLEVRDARNSTVLWSRPFPKEAPRVFIEPGEGTMVLSWHVSSNSARTEIKNSPELSQRFAAMKKDDSDYLLEVLDARTGKMTGGVFVETGKGSFRISDAFAVGSWVVVTDNTNRTLVYSLSAGEQIGKFFGRRAALSKIGTLLCLENERGHLSVYDLKTMQKRDDFSFTSPISYLQFGDDGKQLFVLTAGQTVYWLDLAQGGQTPAATSKR